MYIQVVIFKLESVEIKKKKKTNYVGNSNCMASAGFIGVQRRNMPCKSVRHAHSQECACKRTFGNAAGILYR